MVSLQEKFISLLSSLFAIYITAIDGSREQIEKHLEMGKLFLAKGQFSDALSQYHSAVEIDPENYQSRYRRATCYLATGKSKAALLDLDETLRLKPDFTSARLQRANLKMKYCSLDEAKSDFELLHAKEPDNAEVNSKLDLLEPLKAHLQQANDLFDSGDVVSAEKVLTSLIEHCPMNSELHKKRAACYEEIGEIHKAISDIRSIAKLVPDSTEAYYKISNLYYRMGDVEQSLIQIRECLKLNPEHKECFPFYKKVKKVNAQLDAVTKNINDKNYAECIVDANKVIKTENRIKSIVLLAKEKLCHCYGKEGKMSEALKYCNEVLEEDPENSDTLCDRADMYLLNEKFEDAINDFKAAMSKNEENRRAKEGIERAQKLKKQSQKKDYYKILGIKTNANKKQILKAYRQLAQQWHPDNFKPEEKEAAQKKFIDIAAAKEVLTDPEKRKMFDNGEDPLDPEAQQGHGNPFHGFNPFGGGGNPFGGGGGDGPFQFKFHFQ